MKLWLLRPVGYDDPHADAPPPWEPWYGRTFGMVVRAPDEAAARAEAGRTAGPEGKQAWIDPALSTCVELTGNGPLEVIIEDVWHA